jgi:thienamycin biosynthesis protein ThnN
MTLTHASQPRPADRTSGVQRDDRLHELLSLHFHPQHGSTYWLERQERLGWDVCDRIRTREDLWQLGPTPPADLRRYPLRAFIPRAWHGQWPHFVIGETAGTSGAPQATAYREDEFQAAFITPFLRVAAATGFPRGEPWLWVGPSGPHIIGKVVRELARQTGSMDPFSVDFDPRWAKRLAEGSLARRRYLDHVTSQALEVLRREEIGVLFITPPALAALSEKLTDRQREAIHGVHYGGMSLTAEGVNHFRQMFPNAVHLAGYGNTLFGVVMEMADTPRQAIDYFPLDDRLEFHLVDWSEETGPDNWPPRRVRPGEAGRVVFHRLDASCLLVGVVERDQAECIAPSAAARALGGEADGLRNPQPPTTLSGRLQLGLY